MAIGDIVNWLSRLTNKVVVDVGNGLTQKADLVTMANGAVLKTETIDHTNAPFIVKFNQAQKATTLASPTIINSKTVVLTDATDFNVGNYLVLYSSATDRFFTGYITAKAVNTLTVDTPLDSVFPVGTPSVSTITNMAVDGSSSTQIFGLRGIPVVDPLNETFHVTRIIFNCLTADTVNLSLFADQPALLNGLVLRRRNGDYNNIFNVKSNAEIEGITLDWKPFSKDKPNEGQDGFSARLTFNGQDKLGVVIDLTEGTDLEFLVQDDLTGITKLEVVAEGHILEPEDS